MSDYVLIEPINLTLGVPFILVGFAIVLVFSSGITLVVSSLVPFSWSGFVLPMRGETLYAVEFCQSQGTGETRPNAVDPRRAGFL